MKGIYKIRNKINNKVYIGSSINIKNRWRQHRHQLKHNVHSNPHLQASWNKYTEINFEFSIIEICENLEEKENYYISLNNSITNGYNIRIDCSSNRGVVRTEEFKEACRQRWLGHVQSEEQIQKRVNTIKANKEAGIVRKTGWKLSEDVINDRKKRQYKIVYQYDMNGNYINTHESVQKAAQSVGCKPTSISSCALGIKKSCYKFKWSYFPLESDL